jgi:stress-induced morphogen
MEFENVKNLIKSGLSDAYVEVQDMTGTRDHLDLLIVSDQFVGKMLIQQHQLVMDLLKESLKAEIHAVQLKTMSYADAEKRGIKTDKN